MGGEEEQAEEIRRLLHCAASKADAFAILRLDAESCELADINRNFRKLVLKVHPDKCTLAKAADAFHVAENAHKLLSNEAILVRLKIAHRKKKEKEAEEAARRQASVGPVGGDHGGGVSLGAADEANLSKEERTRRRRREQLVEQQLEAARLAEEAARKKQRVERETKERAELAAELERQRKEWKDLNLF
ncbi:chaperone protein DNAJ [Trypanosoma conorhini]|uniref:Chaperone protein DNAJ n=1 Tax=Trypanosoma conorhini TaxID=83891 RepID=A0A3R7LGG9_9TRYP|nr:chaperone protein DNAJ [Trypanosoma conorhini]RNF26832.1 chaperone protein DNAJ [Trypanosoma conorhini]